MRWSFWQKSSSKGPATKIARRRLRIEPLEERSLLSVSPVGTEFQVNSVTTSSQTFPSVATDAAGDYVVAWDATDGAGPGVYARIYNSAGVPQGTEFLVNTYTTGNQQYPSVAMDAAGDFVVAWQSQQEGVGAYGIYAQRYNLAGTPQGTEFHVNTYTTNNQTTAAVAMDSSGDFVIAWQSNGADGNSFGISAQRYNAAGVAQGTEFIVNTYTSLQQVSPSVAMDAAGDFVVAYESRAEGAGAMYGIYAQRFNSAGVMQGTEFHVNTYTTSNQLNPAVAMDAAGDFVVTWQSGTEDGSGYGIYGQRFNSAGVMQGTEFRVNTYTTSIQSSPTVAMDAKGDFVVSWQSVQDSDASYGVYAQRYYANGLPDGSEFRVNSYTTNAQELPKIAMDAGGDFVVAWQSQSQHNTGFGIYAQRYTLSQTISPSGSEFQVNSYTTGKQQQARVAEDAAGDYVIAWDSYDQDGNLYGIYAQRYNAAGVPQGSEFRVNSYTTLGQSLPVVAMDAAGDFAIAWQSSQDGSSYGIYARRYNSAGVAQGTEFLVNTYTSFSQDHPSIAMDAEGDFVVSWTSGFQDGSSNGVYAQRFNASGVAQGTEFKVNSYTSGNQFNSSVAMDAAGDFVVTWQSYQDGGNYGIYAQRYNAAGALLGMEFRVNTYTVNSQDSPSVAMDAGGDFVVAWESSGEDGDNSGVYAQRFNSAGAPQGPEFRVNSFTTSAQSSPRVAMDAAGDFVVTWQSYQDGAGYGVYAQTFGRTGTPQGTEFKVNTYTTGNQTIPDVARDAEGDYVVSWTSSANHDGSGLGVFAQIYSAPQAAPPPPTPTTVYVDDTWAGTSPGNDPANDPIGGLVFGTNAFADVQSGINAVATGGTVVVYGGTYTGTLNLNKSLTDIEIDTNSTTPAQTLVSLNTAITVSQDTTFVTGTADLTFGSTINDATAGTHNLTVNGTGHAITFSAAVGTTALATLTVSASQSLTLNSSITATGLVSFTSLGAITLSSVSAGSLFASSAGAVTNAASANLAITNNATFDGASVTLGNQSGDSMNFGDLGASSAGSVNIAEDSGMNLDLVSGSTVTLYSTGAITDNNMGAMNVVATTTAELVSGAGIGSLADFLETNVASLSANGANVGLYIANSSSSLNITTVGNTFGAAAIGNVNISTTGDLTVTQSVFSIGGSVNLSAGSAGPSNIILNAAISGTTAQVNGGAGADTFTVNTLGSTPLTLDGAGGGDTYIVNFGLIESSGTVNISDSGGSGTDQAIINGDAGNNAFVVSETQTTYDGTGTVNYTTTLEQLRVNGLAGNDTFAVSPSRYATMLIDGGSPSFGDMGTPPNVDTLNFNALGNSASITGNVITTNGGTPAFKAVSFQDIESVPFTSPGTTTAHYDFNATATSATQAGYTAVLPTRLFGTGTPGSDFGWLTTLPTAGFDRGADASPFSNLIRDGQYGGAGTTGARTFQANVTNGYYMVSVKMGDTSFARDFMQVNNGDTGEVLASNITTAVGQVAERTFIINVTDGTMDLKFSDQGGDPNWVLNGIDIRPALLSTEGFAPQGPFTADGISVDTFTAYNVTPNAEVTVSTTMGKITSADVDPNIAGIQVLANGSGQASISIQRPTGGGQATVSLEEVTGAQTGYGIVNYVVPNTRLFDFNAVGSPTQTPSTPPTIGGYIGVLPTDLYTSSMGYGWVGTLPTGGFDRGGTNALLRDGQYGTSGASGARTFQADLPNGTYTVSITMGDANYGRDQMQVANADTNTVLLSNITTTAGQFYQNVVTVNVTDGSLDLQFSDQGGVDPYWVVNALQIRPANTVTPITVSGPGGNLAADGMTTDSFSVTAAAGSLVTLSTNNGTITGVADASPLYAGIQVLGTGAPISFGIVRPTAAGTTTITAEDVTGAAIGTFSQTYVVAAVREFDFNGSSNTTAAGFIGVLGSNLYSATTGFGWNTPVTSFDRGTASATTVALYQDGAYGTAGAGGARTFEIQVTPGATYGIRVYVGDVAYARDSIQVSAEGGATVMVPNTGVNQFTSVTLTGVDVNNDGILTVTIQDNGGIDPYWVANGMDVALGGVGSLPSAAPLQVAQLGPGGAAAGPLLTTQALAPIVSEAIARWQAAGIGSQAVAMLQGVKFQIANLDSSHELGLATPGLVKIDDNGDGYGWYVDPTPKTDVEFATKVTATELKALPGSAPYNRMDLLTVVMHELGHELGLTDIPTTTNAHALMTESLTPGLRRLPPAMTPAMVTPMKATAGMPLMLGAGEGANSGSGASDAVFTAMSPSAGSGPVLNAAGGINNFAALQTSSTPLRVEANLAALQPLVALPSSSLAVSGGAPKKSATSVDAVFSLLGR